MDISAIPVSAKIIGAVALPHVGGIIGSSITRTAVKGWYNDIKKPNWRPPNWAFPPVWTTLYSCMGYASYLVWRDGGGFEKAVIPLSLYGSNLILNWAWTPIFFGAHNLGLATAEISVLWINIAACIYTFFPINRVASALMVPYLAWTSLATALSYKIWRMNPEEDKDKVY